MEKFVTRLKLIIKEVGNFLANIAVPLISLLIAILGVLPVPTTWLDALKKVEYWLFKVSGTAKDLEEVIEKNTAEAEKKSEAKTLKKATRAQEKALKKIARAQAKSGKEFVQKD